MIIFMFFLHDVILHKTYKMNPVCSLSKHQAYNSSMCLLSHSLHARKEKVSGKEVTSYFPFLAENDILLPRDPCLHLKSGFE